MNFVLLEIGRAIRSPRAKDGGEGGIDSVPSGLCPKAILITTQLITRTKPKTRVAFWQKRDLNLILNNAQRPVPVFSMKSQGKYSDAMVDAGMLWEVYPCCVQANVAANRWKTQHSDG